MKKTWFALLIFVMLAALLVGCDARKATPTDQIDLSDGAAPASEPVKIVDPVVPAAPAVVPPAAPAAPIAAAVEPTLVPTPAGPFNGDQFVAEHDMIVGLGDKATNQMSVNAHPNYSTISVFSSDSGTIRIFKDGQVVKMKTPSGKEIDSWNSGGYGFTLAVYMPAGAYATGIFGVGYNDENHRHNTSGRQFFALDKPLDLGMNLLNQRQNGDANGKDAEKKPWSVFIFWDGAGFQIKAISNTTGLNVLD